MPRADVRWRLSALLQRQAWTPPQFATLLRHGGYPISDSQVYRLLKRAPRRFDRELLAAICDALHCSIADLLEYEPRATGDDVPPAFHVPGT